MTEPTMQALLMEYTKEELRDNTIRLGAKPIAVSSKKAAVVEHLAQEVLRVPKRLLLLLRREEAEALVAQCRKSHTIPLEALYENIRTDEKNLPLLSGLHVLQAYGLTWCENGEYHIRSGLQELLPLDEDNLLDMARNDMLADCINGWLIYVGIMPEEMLYDRALEAIGNRPADAEELELAYNLCVAVFVARSRADNPFFFDDAGQVYLCHDELGDPAALLARLKQPHLARRPYPDFDTKVILDAGANDKLPGNQALYVPLLRWIEQHDILPAAAKLMVYGLVYDTQNDIRSQSVADFLEDVEPWDEEDAQAGLTLVQNLLNAIPQWYNKGYSPQQIFQEERQAAKAPFRMPPPSPFADFPMPATAASIKPAPMPGRNDPCPCGSGKKYKTCCGKRLN